jgi:hypothetical protein
VSAAEEAPVGAQEEEEPLALESVELLAQESEEPLALESEEPLTQESEEPVAQESEEPLEQELGGLQSSCTKVKSIPSGSEEDCNEEHSIPVS